MKHTLTLLTALLLAPLASVIAAQDASLIGHWTFDETAGEVARDSSGKGRDAKIHGATWTKGAVGGALRFDGVDDYVELGDLGEHAAVTIAFWMNGADISGREDFQGLISTDAWEAGGFRIPMFLGGVDVRGHLGGSER